jgi:hypothetical protein
MISDSTPVTSSRVISFPLVIAFSTYKGEVPISPYIIPSAMRSPAADTLFCEDMGVDKFRMSKVKQQKI